jgi:peptidoglycan/LPS O-acetylase OafA/YrhL
MATSSSSRLRYQPALDGLRGVAVLAVMAFHGGISWMTGGYLGVDLFFVLSGFLITTLLLREWAGSGGIALGAFWGRRVRRLFPALALLLVGVALYAHFVADPATVPSLRWDGMASLVYVANWRFVFAHQSYFSGFTAPSPLRHVWSLAVEEQWYLFWPPLLVLLLRRFRASVRTLLVVIAGLAAVSIGLMVITTLGTSDTSRAYYGTDTHAQTLLAGAALAVILHRWPVTSRRARGAVQALGVAGAAVVTVMLWRVPGTARWMYRGGFALFALAGAAVVAGAMMPRAGVLKRALRVRPLVWVGKVSYGLYLWHWPVNVWLNPSRVHLGFWWLLGLRTVVAFAVTAASYYLLELPIRLRRWELRRPKLVTANAAVAVCAVFVLATAPRHVEQRNRIALSSASAGSHADFALPTGPITVPATTVAPTPPATVPPGRPVRVLVVGDSVGWTLSWEQDPVAGLVIQDGAILGCGVLFSQAVVDHQPIAVVPECNDQKRVWAGGIAHLDPDLVVVSYGAWEVYDELYQGHVYEVGDPALRKLLEQALQQDIDFLSASTRGPIVFLDVPCFEERGLSLGGPKSQRNDPRRIAWVNAIIAEMVARNPVRTRLVKISPFLCPGGKFRSSVDGLPLRPDGVHFTINSAQAAWRWLSPQITAIARGDDTTSRSATAGSPP